MRLVYHDPAFEYFYSRASGITGTCDLRVYESVDDLISPGVNVVVATELPTNEGLSVTNGIAQIATRVRVDLGLQPTILVEHYPDRGRGIPETFDVAHLDYNGRFYVPATYPAQRWTPSSRAEVERMIGGRFEDVP